MGQYKVLRNENRVGIGTWTRDIRAGEVLELADGEEPAVTLVRCDLAERLGDPWAVHDAAPTPEPEPAWTPPSTVDEGNADG